MLAVRLTADPRPPLRDACVLTAEMVVEDLFEPLRFTTIQSRRKFRLRPKSRVFASRGDARKALFGDGASLDSSDSDDSNGAERRKKTIVEKLMPKTHRHWFQLNEDVVSLVTQSVLRSPAVAHATCPRQAEPMVEYLDYDPRFFLKAPADQPASRPSSARSGQTGAGRRSISLKRKGNLEAASKATEREQLTGAALRLSRIMDMPSSARNRGRRRRGSITPGARMPRSPARHRRTGSAARHKDSVPVYVRVYGSPRQKGSGTAAKAVREQIRLRLIGDQPKSRKAVLASRFAAAMRGVQIAKSAGETEAAPVMSTRVAGHTTHAQRKVAAAYGHMIPQGAARSHRISVDVALQQMEQRWLDEVVRDKYRDRSRADTSAPDQTSGPETDERVDAGGDAKVSKAATDAPQPASASATQRSRPSTAGTRRRPATAETRQSRPSTAATATSTQSRLTGAAGGTSRSTSPSPRAACPAAATGGRPLRATLTGPQSPGAYTYKWNEQHRPLALDRQRSNSASVAEGAAPPEAGVYSLATAAARELLDADAQQDEQVVEESQTAPQPPDRPRSRANSWADNTAETFLRETRYSAPQETHAVRVSQTLGGAVDMPRSRSPVLKVPKVAVPTRPATGRRRTTYPGHVSRRPDTARARLQVTAPARESAPQEGSVARRRSITGGSQGHGSASVKSSLTSVPPQSTAETQLPARERPSAKVRRPWGDSVAETKALVEDALLHRPETGDAVDPSLTLEAEIVSPLTAAGSNRSRTALGNVIDPVAHGVAMSPVASPRHGGRGRVTAHDVYGRSNEADSDDEELRRDPLAVLHPKHTDSRDAALEQHVEVMEWHSWRGRYNYGAAAFPVSRESVTQWDDHLDELANTDVRELFRRRVERNKARREEYARRKAAGEFADEGSNAAEEEGAEGDGAAKKGRDRNEPYEAYVPLVYGESIAARARQIALATLAGVGGAAAGTQVAAAAAAAIASVTYARAASSDIMLREMNLDQEVRRAFEDAGAAGVAGELESLGTASDVEIGDVDDV